MHLQNFGRLHNLQPSFCFDLFSSLRSNVCSDAVKTPNADILEEEDIHVSVHRVPPEAAHFFYEKYPR